MGRDEDLDCVEDDIGFGAFVFAVFAFNVGVLDFGLAVFDRLDVVFDFDADEVFGLALDIEAFKFAVVAVFAFGFAEALALGLVPVVDDLVEVFFALLRAFDDFAFVDVELVFEFVGFFFGIAISYLRSFFYSRSAARFMPPAIGRGDRPIVRHDVF